jgi:hypothetical protein
LRNLVRDIALEERRIHSSGSAKVVEATNFGMLLSRTTCLWMPNDYRNVWKPRTARGGAGT